MSEFAILGASYLGPEGHGNDLTGLRPWPAALNAALQRGDLADLHWSLLFASDPGRFGRMDLMSRLGLMAVELLDLGLDSMPPARRDRLGVAVETGAGSVATDVRFLETPRASLFTYTLPSTVIGEICIRYRLRGPVLCLMNEGWDPAGPGTPASSSVGSSGVVAEGMARLETGEAESCICVCSEAVDSVAAATLQPAGPRATWRAGALFLGKRESGSRAYPLPSTALAETCRALCQCRPSFPA